GGAALTSYTVTANDAAHTHTSGAGSPLTVTGLTNGTAYTFTVHATNAAGDSAESSPSSSVTAADVPGAPAIGTATAGNAQASVAVTDPTADGGSALTGYTVTATAAAHTHASGAGSPLPVPGLT